MALTRQEGATGQGCEAHRYWDSQEPLWGLPYCSHLGLVPSKAMPCPDAQHYRAKSFVRISWRDYTVIVGSSTQEAAERLSS